MLPLLLAAVTLLPLQGAPLTGPTQLRLLVVGPSRTPFVYDVDRRRVTPVRGIATKGRGIYWVITVRDSPSGPLAVLDRGCRSCHPRQLAYRVSFDGRARRVPLSQVPTSPRPASKAAPLPGGFALARAGQTLTLIDPGGGRTPLAWPSILTWFGGVSVQPGGAQALVTFADPAWNDGPAQAMDAFMLDPATGAFATVPGFPAVLDLKFSELRWLPDGRLVFLGRTGGHGVLALWSSPDAQPQIRRARLPGTGSFAVF
jgi:hypothetical protein